MKLKNLILFILFFAHLALNAQNVSIQGRVFNSKNNEAIPFANILIDGTTSGVLSDAEGKFQFSNIKPGYVKLFVRFIGFETFLSNEFLVTLISHKLRSTHQFPKRGQILNEELMVAK